MRICCLYENEFVRIEEFFTVCDGKQINIEGKIEEFRKLGKANKLFCHCGCGRNVVIVAGPNMVKRQHFRLKPGQDSMLGECKASEENEITVHSKIILKCWLDAVFKLNEGSIEYNMPINNAYDSDRRYEFTHFVREKMFGLCYERKANNLDDEKIELLYKNTNNRTLYITDISNKECKYQYPEYNMKIQNAQGFCMFLDCKGENDYNNAELYISNYQKCYNGVWKELSVLHSKLNDFYIDEDFALCYKDEKVVNKVNEKISEFENEQYAIVKRNEEIRIENERCEREEQERLRIENEQREIAKQERLRYEREQQEKQERLYKQSLELQREQKRIEVEREKTEVLRKKPKIKELVDFLSSVDILEGDFCSRQSDGTIKKCKETIVINKIDFDVKSNRIQIIDYDNYNHFIYIQESESHIVDGCRTGSTYVVFPIYLYLQGSVAENFSDYFICKKYEVVMKKEVYCTLEDAQCPYLDENNNRCMMEVSQCSYRSFV